MRAAFTIGGEEVAVGARKTVDLPVGSFNNHMPSRIPVRVVHGRREGPTLFISAVVHGDEIIGVEIIRRLLKSPLIKSLKGTLLCVPVVNTYGFISHSRYLPDRRDLNRSFPGTPNGSLAGQLANVFMTEIVARSDFGIDIHSAATHRVNLPQIRYCPNNSGVSEFAQAFGAPLRLEAPLRENSLRQAAQRVGVDILLYEAGEALRLDEYAVRIGVRGILNVMGQLGMIAKRKRASVDTKSVYSKKSNWLRSNIGGIFRATSTIGDSVQKDETLGYICDPFGDREDIVAAPQDGIIIGRSNMPIVNPGEALFHIAQIHKLVLAGEKLSQMEDEIESDPLFDEDEII